MNIFTTIPLLAFFIMIFLGIFVLYKDPRNVINRLFFGYCMVGCYGSFIEFNILQGESFERVNFWLKNYTLILIIIFLSSSSASI